MTLIGSGLRFSKIDILYLDFKKQKLFSIYFWTKLVTTKTSNHLQNSFFCWKTDLFVRFMFKWAYDVAIRYFNTHSKYKRRATIKRFACEGHGRKMNFFKNAGPSQNAVSGKNAERGTAPICIFSVLWVFHVKRAQWQSRKWHVSPLWEYAILN